MSLPQYTEGEVGEQEEEGEGEEEEEEDEEEEEEEGGEAGMELPQQQGGVGQERGMDMSPSLPPVLPFPPLPLEEESEHEEESEGEEEEDLHVVIYSFIPSNALLLVLPF